MIAWGYIFDKFGFKFPYIIICLNQLICGLVIYISPIMFFTYFIVVCLGVFSYVGHIILFTNLINIKFGVDNSVVILGICGLFTEIPSLIRNILTLFMLREVSDYFIIYLIGVGPTIISLILTFNIKIQYMKDTFREDSDVNEIIENDAEN